MKSFITKTILLGVLIFISAPVIILTASYFSSSVDWRLPQQKHVLFMGASHIVHAIDDSITDSAINLAKESERYMFTYIKLQHLIEHNTQIDTIFLECAPTDLFEHTDHKYFKDNEMVSFFATYYPLFNTEQWLIYKGKFATAFTLLYRKTVVDYIRGINYTYFSSKFPPRTQTLDRNKVHYDPVKGIYGYEINYKYLRKIIDLCNENGVKLYFLYCPVYKPEYYYDQNYYYNAYKTYFSDVELLDYSHYSMDDDERYDAHHLNDKGAIKFTKMLKVKYNL